MATLMINTMPIVASKALRKIALLYSAISFVLFLQSGFLIVADKFYQMKN